MKIAVLGTGMVGRALAKRFAETGHEVAVATRDVEKTLARHEAGSMGTPPYSEWQQANPHIRLVPFAEAGRFAEVVVNATHGANSLPALEAVGGEALAGKVLIDLALPLDFSQGMPPKLLIANTDSLGEQIQRAYPQARVVKTFNTMFCKVMVDPKSVPGPHNIFLAGDDEAAKQTVRQLLAEFGWSEDVMIDLGGIDGARATEMYMQLYFRLTGIIGFDFNIAVMRA
ncbi:MAG: NADP oxidoreductase [Stutzerimonas stutzeri]|nr:MAG: NADP oxidoreductase [Stutzerimonas stutzeri]